MQFLCCLLNYSEKPLDGEFLAIRESSWRRILELKPFSIRKAYRWKIAEPFENLFGGEFLN